MATKYAVRKITGETSVDVTVLATKIHFDKDGWALGVDEEIAKRLEQIPGYEVPKDVQNEPLEEGQEPEGQEGQEPEGQEGQEGQEPKGQEGQEPEEEQPEQQNLVQEEMQIERVETSEKSAEISISKVAPPVKKAAPKRVVPNK
jgi:hypothetical protein